MKLSKKTALFCALILVIPMLFSFTASAYYDKLYESYSYFDKMTVTAAPEAYSFKDEIKPETLGLPAETVFSDIKYSEGLFYLLDKSNGRVITITEAGKPEKIICADAGLSAPEGFYISKEGYIYIADTGNARIVKFDKNGRLCAEVGAPDPKVTLSDASFAPVKVVVDRAERIYALSRDETNGIYQLGIDGSFYGFYGSVPIVPSITELLWRAVSTKAQLSQMLLFVPTEYSGMDIDSDGFVYTTVSTNTDSEMLSFLMSGSKELAPIRRLNPKGEDVLRRKGGSVPPMGDAIFSITDTRETLSSKLTEVAVYKNGIYSVLDNTRCRIFTYDSDGNFLYEFAGRGDAVSDLSSPEAICYFGDNIAVLDTAHNSVKLFYMTEYAANIAAAVTSEKNGNYKASQRLWNSVLTENPGCRAAYCGMGRQALRDGEYKTAMKLFKFADDSEGYSDAYSLLRSEAGAKYAAPAIIVIIAVIVLAVLLIKRLKKNKKTVKDPSALKILARKTSYGFYIMRHPFDGFWDMSFENRGSVGGATVILAAVVILNLLTETVSGYLVAGVKLPGSNLLVSGCAGILVPAALWCVANWSVTSLMNGSGNMKRIYMYTCYSLTPLLLIMPVLIAASHLITYDETALYGIINMLMYIWMAFLLFAGTAVVHQYSSGKTLLAIIVIFIAIAVILFLLLLCVTIFQQMSEFVVNVSEEIALRS